MNLAHPRAPAALPLKGAMPAARQSRIRGMRLDNPSAKESAR
jgi:hypothetical protein